MGILTDLELKWANLKLKNKLIISFLLVFLLSIAVVTTVISVSTKMFFNHYITNINEGKLIQLADYFAVYYERNNYSWDGVEHTIFFDAKNFDVRKVKSRGDLIFGPNRMLLIDNQGNIVADSFKRKEDNQLKTEFKYSIEKQIIFNNKSIGKLMFVPMIPRGVLSVEDQFLQSVLKATLLAIIAGATVAIMFGILLSKRLSIPLVSLTEAAQKLGKKDFKYRLFVAGEDEIGQLSRAFNEMADALEKNEQLRNNLVADVAHELRTPITILRGNLESLQAGVIEPSEEIIVSLHDEILRLSRLIDDLQELSLAESGQLTLYYSDTNLVELIARVATSYKTSINKKKLNLNLDLPDTEVVANVDKDRITQVIANILSNAIRHTPEEGEIKVSIREGENRVCIAVADTGSGIKPEDRDYIFERFYRGSKSRNRADGGSGLGLAITKGLVEAHGGTIELECPETRGSIFMVKLPKKV